MNFKVEKLKVAIEKGTWECDALAESDNFYRMLFQIERQPKITKVEVHCMFASYINWREQINELIEECLLEKTDDNLKATQYAEQLDDDILHQMFHIVTKVPCDETNLVAELDKLANNMEA